MVKAIYGCKLLMQPGAHQYDYFITYTNTEGTIEQENCHVFLLYHAHAVETTG